MLGIGFYGALAFGLGLLVPLGKADGPNSIGLRFVAGIACLILALYATMVLLAVPLRHSMLLIGALAAAGWIRAALQNRILDLSEAIVHPALILPAFAAIVASVYGPIDYIPYLVDEFTNWIGVSRIIHWADSYEAVRKTIYLPGYTPGWRLLLLAPWQVTGAIDHGLSTAAPFILHVATLALIYDLTVILIRRSGALPPAMSQGAAWLILLLFLTAEGMGRLWTFEMLIEQPQIYMLSAATLLVLRAELSPLMLRPLYALAGIVLAAGFLLKNAVLAAAPAALLVAALALITSEAPITERLREGAVRAALLLLPLAITMLSWTAIVPSDNCLSSPMSVFTAGKGASYDAIDLARRFIGALGTYVLQYKLAVTLTAAAGLALGIYLGLWRAVLFSTVFAAVYFASLYWYHLGCFGEYYYRELNSIPRFSRVPIQVLHTLGLLLLATGILGLANARWPGIAVKRGTMLTCIGLAIGLSAWHVRQTYRTVADLTTRAHQKVDPRIAEMQMASAFIERRIGLNPTAQPTLAILGQGQDGDVRAYATYFSHRPVPGGHVSLFRVHPGTSWSPNPLNVWQAHVTAEAVIEELATADILWPLQLDPWLTEQLRILVADEACITRLPNVALVRTVTGDVTRFQCHAKDS